MISAIQHDLTYSKVSQFQSLRSEIYIEDTVV